MADEQDLQRLALEYLAIRQVRAWRNNAGVAHGHVRYGLQVGASDIIGILSPSGRMFACELKAPGEKPRPEQLAFLEEIRSSGGRAFWTDSFDRFQIQVEKLLDEEARAGRKRSA